MLFLLLESFGGEAGGVTGAEILKPLGFALGICLLGIWTGEILSMPGIVIAGVVDGEAGAGPAPPWDGGGVGVPLGIRTAAMVMSEFELVFGRELGLRLKLRGYFFDEISADCGSRRGKLWYD